MKCKTIHKKLIFFLEGSLSGEEAEQVGCHLSTCSDCFSFAEELKSTLGIIDKEKSAETNPFFYTRLKARMENKEAEPNVKRSPVLQRILQPVALSALLILGIYSGIKIGQAPGVNDSGNSLSEQEIIPFLNEMEDEPIEVFLMENL